MVEEGLQNVSFVTLNLCILSKLKTLFLGFIETCPKFIYAVGKNMEKISLHEKSKTKCSPKEFLLKYFALDKTGLVLNKQIVDSQKIKLLLDKCRCIESSKKRKFVVHFQEPSSMFTKITEMENQYVEMPWYRRGLSSKIWHTTSSNVKQ